MKTFSELPLCSILQRNLSRQCLTDLTPVQAQAIPPALAGGDVVATAPTGTGKTLAFLAPLLESLVSAHATTGPRTIQAVILTPTRELAIQINEVLVWLAAGTGIRSTVVVGGLNEQSQLRGIKSGAQILIATPGRLCDFLNRKLVNLSTVRTLVMDEADRMLDMGFLPSIRLVLAAVPRTRQTLFFSATIEKSVAHLIDSYLRNPVRVSVGTTTKPIDKVTLHLYEVEQDRKLSLLTKLLHEEQGSFLVFARTKHGTDRLAKKLAAAGVKAGRIHGDRTQNQRNQALDGFKDGGYRVLVATDVAARGIHVDGIAHVVNYDLPQVPEDFIHRVGRTGRAGAGGTATTFSARAERSEVRKIERELGIRFITKTVTEELAREQKLAPNVIVIPAKTRAFDGLSKVRSFGPSKFNRRRQTGTR